MNTKSVVNILLIINAIAFLIDMLLNLSGIFGLYYFESPAFHLYQPITYMFMHGGFTHIFFNMFALWMFGRMLEQVWGAKKFLIYYLVCGIGAAIIQEIGQFIGLINPMSMTIGASGAVYGILLAFGMTFPEEKLFVFPLPIPIKAKYFVLIYIIIELVEGFGATDGVAHFAHLGGMFFGAMLFLYWRNKYKKPTNSKIKMEVIYDSYSKDDKSGYSQTPNYEYSTSETTDTTDYKKIDAILDKIKKQGYECLTEEEKTILFNASNRK